MLIILLKNTVFKYLDGSEENYRLVTLEAIFKITFNLVYYTKMHTTVIG